MNNYINSLLSDISYIHSLVTLSNLDLQTTNNITNNRNLSNFDLIFFNDNFEVIDQIEEANGFSATTFRAKSNIGNYSSGDVFIAYRGTEPSQYVDLITDLTIATGVTDTIILAQNIINTVVNIVYEGKISISQTSSAIQYLEKIHSLYPNKKINISGHSLGGHLAVASTLAHSEWVNETITFNAVGFSLIDAIISNTKNGLFGLFEDIGEKISFIYSFTNLEGTATPFLSHIGTRIPIYTEDISWESAVA